MLTREADEKYRTTLEDLGDVFPREPDRRVDDSDRRRAPDIEGKSLIGETRRIMLHS